MCVSRQLGFLSLILYLDLYADLTVEPKWEWPLPTRSARSQSAHMANAPRKRKAIPQRRSEETWTRRRDRT